MKRFALLYFTFSFCTQVVNAQEQRALPACPTGYHAVGVSYQIDQFNFHKPRTNCTSGFGICVRGHWETICAPNTTAHKTKLKDGKVDIWFVIRGNQLELHLPIALKEADAFSSEDMMHFVVEKNSFELRNPEGLNVANFKEGTYQVEESDDDLIILIDLY